MADNKYEIKTLRDMVEKVPPEKIDAFVEDLRRALRGLGPVRNLLDAVAESMTDGEVEEITGWDGTMTWIDDGENKSVYRVNDDNGDDFEFVIE